VRVVRVPDPRFWRHRSRSAKKPEADSAARLGSLHERRVRDGDDEPSSEYSVVRHAALAEAPVPDDELAWVVAAHWTFCDGSQEWFVEYWDRVFNEEGPETRVASEAEGVAHAESLFGPLRWQDGMPVRRDGPSS
jgi:hypothetical protein